MKFRFYRLKNKEDYNGNFETDRLYPASHSVDGTSSCVINLATDQPEKWEVVDVESKFEIGDLVECVKGARYAYKGINYQILNIRTDTKGEVYYYIDDGVSGTSTGFIYSEKIFRTRNNDFSLYDDDLNALITVLTCDFIDERVQGFADQVLDALAHQIKINY